MKENIINKIIQIISDESNEPDQFFTDVMVHKDPQFIKKEIEEYYNNNPQEKRLGEDYDELYFRFWFYKDENFEDDQITFVCDKVLYHLEKEKI